MEQPKKTNHIMLIVTLFITCFIFFRYCIPVGGFILTFILLGLISITTIYLHKNGHFNKKQIPYMIFLILLAISYSIYTNHGLIFFQNILFLLVFLYYILVACKTRTNNKIDENVIGDTFYQSIPAIGKKPNIFEKKQNNNGLIIGLVLFVPIFAIILALLSKSSLVFNYYLGNILDTIRTNLFVAVISIPATLALFRIIFNNSNKFHYEQKQSDFQKQNTLFKIILSVFSIIYILFIISSYFDITGFVPKDVAPATIANYARSGFFELCVVSIINIGIFIASKKFTDSDKTNKILLSSIGICTIGIILIALFKMYTYIQTLGFTLLRFNTSFFMVCLLIAVILATIGIRKKFNYIGISFSAIAILFLVLCFFNEEGFITSYNINQATNGKIKLDDTVFVSDIQASKYYPKDNNFDPTDELTVAAIRHMKYNHCPNKQRRKINYTLDYIWYHQNIDECCKLIKERDEYNEKTTNRE